MGTTHYNGQSGPDSYSYTTTSSYGENVSNDAGNVLIGVLLLALGVALLVWNEGKAFRQHMALREGIRRVISIVANAVNPMNEMELVHLVGHLKAGHQEAPVMVQDAQFGIQVAHTLKLRRRVEMYQWREHKEEKEHTRMGGEKVTETTYSYAMEWSDRVIDSSAFERSHQYQNPSCMRFEQYTDVANPITVGAFTLPPEMVEKISWYQPLNLKDTDNTIPDFTLRQQAQSISSGYFFPAESQSSNGSTTLSNPSIGDHKVTYQSIPEQTASLVAQQVGNSFRGYWAKHGGTISILEPGEWDALQLFERNKSNLECRTWGLRFLGLILLYIGFWNVFSFLSTIFSFLPLLSKLVGGALGVVSLILAVVLGIVTIVLSWILQRCYILCCEPFTSMGALYRENQHRQANQTSITQQQQQQSYNYQSIPVAAPAQVAPVDDNKGNKYPVAVASVV